MIGLPSQYRFTVQNDCGEVIEVDLKYRLQKLDATGALEYGDWVDYLDQASDTVAATAGSILSGVLIDNTTDKYLGAEIWYAYNFDDASSIDANGLITMRLQSYYLSDTEYQEDGDGIILASDFVITTDDTTAADIASGVILL